MARPPKEPPPPTYLSKLGPYNQLADIQGGNMNESDASPAGTINEITWSRYVTLDSLISFSILAGGASDLCYPLYVYPQADIANPCSQKVDSIKRRDLFLYVQQSPFSSKLIYTYPP